MAGKPISRKYMARIRDYGIANIFERVENGETVKSIAATLHMSRGWLSTYLNHDPYTAEALALCRAVAAYRRLAALADAAGSIEARRYVANCMKVDTHTLRLGVANSSALHLEALKRAEKQRPQR